MNKSRKIFTLQEAKIQASILLKSIGSSDPGKMLVAAKRFQRLTEFADFSLAEIPQQNIKHKHALAVIALENGFKSWMHLKSQIGLIVGGFLNNWFANYEEATAFLQSNGGFLFPYKNQFFVCGAGYIERLGFNSKDPDWALIGWNWEIPANKIAWQRLNKQWKVIQGEIK